MNFGKLDNELGSRIVRRDGKPFVALTPCRESEDRTVFPFGDTDEFCREIPKAFAEREKLEALANEADSDAREWKAIARKAEAVNAELLSALKKYVARCTSASPDCEHAEARAAIALAEKL